MGKSVSLTLRRHVVRLLFWTSLLLLVASPLDGVRVSRLVREKLKEQRQRRSPQWLQRGMIPLHLLCNIEAEWPMRAFLCLFLGPLSLPPTSVFYFTKGEKWEEISLSLFNPLFPLPLKAREVGRRRTTYCHAAAACRALVRQPSVCPSSSANNNKFPSFLPRSLPLSFTAVTGDEVSCRPQPASQSRAARRGRRCGDYRSPC